MADPLRWLVLLALVAGGGCDDNGTQPDGGADAGDADSADGDASDADLPPCPADMVLVDDWGSAAFCIDIHEHPGAESSPSTGLAWREANAACVDLRRQLCTVEQWREGCAGTPAGPCLGPIQPTGLREECVSDRGLYDMVGNAAEFTATPGTSATFFVLGGSGISEDRGCSVEEEFEAERRRTDIGFRCCRSPR